MKSKKDISDLIRNNQHKLEERPAARVWEKLEGKLDNHQSKSRVFLYRKLAMAAAVVAMVAVISLLTVMTTNSKDTARAEANIGKNWMSQDFETISTDGNKNLRAAIEFQRKLKNRYPNKIKEGQDTKKLLASNSISNDVINRSPIHSKPAIAMNKTEKTTNKKIIEKADVADATLSFSDVTSASAKEEIQTENFDVAEIEAVEDDVAANMEIVIATDAVMSTAPKANPSQAKEAKKMVVGNPDMSWLVGKWKSETDEINWEKESDSKFSSENFIIQKNNSQWNFIVKSNAENPYELKTDSDGKMIFRSKNKDTVSFDWKNKNSFFIIFYNNTTYELERKKYSKN